MSSDLAVEDKSLSLYPGGERNNHSHHHHHHHQLSQQQQHHQAQMKPAASSPPPPQMQLQTTASSLSTTTATTAATASKNPLDDEPTSADDEDADEMPPPSYYSHAAARLQKLREQEHERLAAMENSSASRGDEADEDAAAEERQQQQRDEEERRQHGVDQQQQQYSSLMDHQHQQQRLLLQQHHHLLASLPMGSSGGGIDSSSAAAIKSEATSNGSDDRDAAAASAMEFCPVTGAGGLGIGDYGSGDGSHRDSLSSTVVRTRRRKAGLAEDERICAVCGDPASGYNFDRLTCESCKAFFRRNALKVREKIKPCSRGGGCDVSGSQRKHCPSCRLEKCLRVGMKKELILPPEKLEQRAKPKKRLKNGQQQPAAAASAAAANAPPSGGSSAHLPGGPSIGAGGGVALLAAAAAAAAAASASTAPAPSQRKRSGGQHHHRGHHQQQHQQHHQPPALHPSNGGGGGGAGGVDLDPPLLGVHQQLHQAQQQHQQPPLYSQHQRSRLSPSPSPTAAYCSRPLGEVAQVWAAGTAAGRCWPSELTATDRECLSSLEEALCRVRETLVSDEAAVAAALQGRSKDGIGRLEQAFNQMDACIRRIISVVKLIPIFSDVEKDSQILMLKVNIYGLVILYSSFFFNPATGAWEMPIAHQHQATGSRSISLMQELAGSVGAIIEMRPDVSELTPADLEQYKANTDNVYSQLERYSCRDDLVKMLMLALKLFNSDTMPASVRGPIDEAQSVYSQLLKKYLACKFGVSEAMQMYPRLLMTFIDMRTVENKMTEFTKLLSVESLNPLVREVTQVN